MEIAREMEERIREALVPHFAESHVDVELLGDGAVRLLCKVRTREEAYPGVQQNLRLLATTINREVLGKHYREFHLSPSSALVVLNRRQGALPEGPGPAPHKTRKARRAREAREPVRTAARPPAPRPVQAPVRTVARPARPNPSRPPEPAAATKSPPAKSVPTNRPPSPEGRARGRAMLAEALERRLAEARTHRPTPPPPSVLPGAGGVNLDGEDPVPPPPPEPPGDPDRAPHRVPSLLAELDRITRTGTPPRLTLPAPVAKAPEPARIVAAPERKAARQGFRLESPLPLPQSQLALLHRRAAPQPKPEQGVLRRHHSQLVPIGKETPGLPRQAPLRAPRPARPRGIQPAPDIPLPSRSGTRAAVPARAPGKRPHPGETRLKKLWSDVFEYWRWPWGPEGSREEPLPPVETVRIPDLRPRHPPPQAPARPEFEEGDLTEIEEFGQNFRAREFFEEDFQEVDEAWDAPPRSF